MIGLTKKYQTRGGLPVRIYAVDGAFQLPHSGWTPTVWTKDGFSNLCGTKNKYDLIPVKSWRAWDPSRDMVPKRLMTKTKNALGGQCTDGITLVYPGSLQFIFDNFTWLHEDGSETPCGVCE
jgi:hypothetical protein